MYRIVMALEDGKTAVHPLYFWKVNSRWDKRAKETLDAYFRNVK